MQSAAAKEGERRSTTTRCIVAIVGAALHWVRQVQKITLTSNEAEYVAICRVAQGIVFLRHPVLMLNAEQNQTTIIIDNTTVTRSCAEGNAQSKPPRHAETTDGENISPSSHFGQGAAI